MTNTDKKHNEQETTDPSTGWNSRFRQYADVSTPKSPLEDQRTAQPSDYFAKKADQGKERTLICRRFVETFFVKGSKNPWIAVLRSRATCWSSKLEVLSHIEAALEYGLKKYGKKDSWKTVDNASERYFQAFRRHSKKADTLDNMDEESQLPHEWLMECNMYFLGYFWQVENDALMTEKPYSPPLFPGSPLDNSGTPLQDPFRITCTDSTTLPQGLDPHIGFASPIDRTGGAPLGSGNCPTVKWKTGC